MDEDDNGKFRLKTVEDIDHFMVVSGFSWLYPSSLPFSRDCYRRSLAVWGTICLSGHFGGVSEIQNSLDVSDLYKGHKG